MRAVAARSLETVDIVRSLSARGQGASEDGRSQQQPGKRGDGTGGTPFATADKQQQTDGVQRGSAQGSLGVCDAAAAGLETGACVRSPQTHCAQG